MGEDNKCEDEDEDDDDGDDEGGDDNEDVDGDDYEDVKNTIRDGGSTALYTVYIVFTVNTVNTVFTVQTALHCLNSSMLAYIQCPAGRVFQYWVGSGIGQNSV